ncbi:MAG: carbohydrate binding family 9 domain-containing protein [Gemmatimonadaceae bacterium]|nr:carbohydrate binding family 9 domain-containing protein [Gemmatimonadaceae bacterium]MCW5827621.1 carbohydrate binding family 9 domain-containing protein [Gemmatimonadaceae bacterium]
MLRPAAALAILLLGTIAPRAAAQSGPERVPRVRTTAQDIRLDGILDEPDYALADSIWEFRQKEPVEGAAPSERTVVRLLATPKGLVVGWWVYDRNPQGIVRTQLRRDAPLRSDDYVSMVIDGLSDRRSGFFFRTNANGAMWDGEHISFEVGNEEWDGVWDVRTQITADGWTAEMLIPWATLRYPKDVSQMGMNFRRFLPRTNEELLWRAWRRTEGLRFLEREGTIAGFENLPRRARAELRPYVLGQAAPAERSFGAGGATGIVREANAFGRAGLDVKVPVTNTITADLTANPDFAQADVDRQIVNLTRFPLFFPERRWFFTEGAGVFAFGREQQTQMFYSRRIGLGADGTPQTIPLGARIQGRAGAYQLGVLYAETRSRDDVRDAVLRLRRDVLGRGYVGVMGNYSDRDSRPGSAAGGVDFALPWILRGTDNFVVLGNAAWSRDSIGGATGGHYRIVADYPNDHADIVVRYDRVEQGYDPALGFVLQRGIHRLGGSTAITPRPKDARVIRRWEFNLLSYDVVWADSGALDNARMSVRPLGAQFQSGDRLELNLHRVFDAPATSFVLLPGTSVPAGEYWWSRTELAYRGANVRAVVPTVALEWGTFYRGERFDLRTSLLARVQPHYEFTLEFELNAVDLPTDSFVAHTGRLRADYAINPRLMLTGFAQFDDQSDRAALNARLRWTPSPGSDLFIVWNSVWPTVPEGAFAVLRPQRGALVLKYTQYLRI